MNEHTNRGQFGRRLFIGAWLIFGAMLLHANGQNILSTIIALTAVITLGNLLWEIL